VFPPGAIEAIVGTTSQAGDVLSSTSSAIAAGSSDLECLGRDIFTFLVASVVVVPLAKTLKVSPVLGFLLVGCVLGPFGLATFSNNAADLELGDFGILFLLFNEGLALTPERIRDLNRFSTLGLIQLVTAIALFSSGIIFGGQYILDFVEGLGIPLNDDLLRPILDSPVQAFSIAAAGALSSSAFVLPVLSQKKWKDRPEGIAGLSILLLQDLAVAPLLVIIPLLAGSGPQSWSEFGLLLAKASLGFGTVLVFGSYILRYVFDVVASARSTETFVSFVPCFLKETAAKRSLYLRLGQLPYVLYSDQLECFLAVVFSANPFIAFYTSL
jgi:Kef-type K+ transport system membrane component KefB